MSHHLICCISLCLNAEKMGLDKISGSFSSALRKNSEDSHVIIDEFFTLSFPVRMYKTARHSGMMRLHNLISSLKYAPG